MYSHTGVPITKELIEKNSGVRKLVVRYMSGWQVRCDLLTGCRVSKAKYPNKLLVISTYIVIWCATARNEESFDIHGSRDLKDKELIYTLGVIFHVLFFDTVFFFFKAQVMYYTLIILYSEGILAASVT